MLSDVGNEMTGEHPRQLELDWRAPRHTPEAFHALVMQHAGGPVDMTVTRNRVSMVSVRFGLGGRPRVRVHEAFLAAPEPIAVSLGQYLSTRARADWRVVADYAGTIRPVAAESRRVAVRTRGRVYDLAVIHEAVNRRYFNGQVKCRIGWGGFGRRRRRARSRHIRYGSYNAALNLVRIHPLLDDERVPLEFMEYIVFHELLHAAVPSERGAGRWRHHPGHYRTLERQFPDLERMQRLSRELVEVLGGRA